MNTRSYYESLIMKDIKDIPDESLPYLRSILNDFKNLLNNALYKGSCETQSTGFCGSWQDSRKVDEIIKDIEQGRNYFSGRDFQ